MLNLLAESASARRLGMVGCSTRIFVAHVPFSRQFQGFTLPPTKIIAYRRMGG